MENKNCSFFSCLFYSSVKKHSLEENEDLDELTTDSMSFEAQAGTKKKAAIRTIGTI